MKLINNDKATRMTKQALTYLVICSMSIGTTKRRKYFAHLYLSFKYELFLKISRASGTLYVIKDGFVI